MLQSLRCIYVVAKNAGRWKRPRCGLPLGLVSAQFAFIFVHAPSGWVSHCRRYSTLLWLFVGLHGHRARNSSRVGSAGGLRFQRPLSLRQKSDVSGHYQHLGWRGTVFSISAFGMDGNGIRRRLSLVCCVLRGKGLEAKVWGFVRAVLLRSLAVAAALAWTIATHRHSLGAKETGSISYWAFVRGRARRR